MSPPTVHEVLERGTRQDLIQLLTMTYQVYCTDILDTDPEGLSFTDAPPPEAPLAPLSPRESLNLMAALAFRAGALGSVALVNHYEALIRTLEALHEHGLKAFLKANPLDPTQVTFLIRLPGEEDTYLEIHHRSES